MFKLIDRYIASQVIVASLSVLILLVCLRSLFNLIDELGHSGQGDYQITDVLLYVGLMFPARLLEFFPMSVLIGALFALGNMATHSELTILRASGMTSWQIAWASIRASLILVLLAFALSEWVSPASTEKAQQLRTAAISSGEVSFSKTGFWVKRDNEIIRIGRLLDNGQLRNITFYQMSSDAQLIAIIQSSQAIEVEGQWLLKDNVETYFHQDNIETLHQKSRVWLNPLQQSQVNTLTLQPDSLSLLGVVRYLDYLRDNELPTESFELMFWQKLVQPIAIAVMVFLATSFVFGPMRNVSMGARILSGVMLGFVFHLTSQSFGPISLVFNFYPMLGAILPLVLFGLLGFWLMRRNS